MAAPEGAVEFRIHVCAGLRRLMRDGAEIGAFSHADRAAPKAVTLARELQETGPPAVVLLQAQDRTLVLDSDPRCPGAPPTAAPRLQAP